MSFYVTPIRSIVVKGKRVNVKLNPSQKRQELFRDVFRIKTGHRSLIFKFKAEQRFEYVNTSLQLFNGTHSCDNYLNFKKYSQGIGAEYPIKNRSELFILMRDWARCYHYLQPEPYYNLSPSDLNEGTPCKHIHQSTTRPSMMETNLLEILEVAYHNFNLWQNPEHYSIELKQYYKILRNNEKFDKNCKSQLHLANLSRSNKAWKKK